MSLLLNAIAIVKNNGSNITNISISSNNKNFLIRRYYLRSLVFSKIGRRSLSSSSSSSWLLLDKHHHIERINQNNKIKIIKRNNNNNSKSLSSSSSSSSSPESILELSESIIHSIPIEDIRNFSFIAHVDHGKSSLASRVLEHTGNINPKTNKSSSNNNNNNTKEQINELDTLEVEQERGITVKATAASMIYKHKSAIGPTGYILLNMVDTPGHTDFGSEVRRSLAFVQGAVILFDAVRGIQAQSWNVYEHAKKNNITLIPALTKIDLPNARSLDVTLSIADLFHFDPDYVLNTSARNRIGIEELLHTVCTDIPSPASTALCYNHHSSSTTTILRAQIIDSWYEQQRGVICLIQVVSGSIKEGDKISVLQSERTTDNNHNNNASYSVQELGLVLPKKHRMKKLTPGLMGYAILGIHNPSLSKPGSTITLTKDWNTYCHHNDTNNNNTSNIDTIILPNTLSSSSSSINQSVIFASVHPSYPEEFDDLTSAIDRLALNDSGLDLDDQGSSTVTNSSLDDNNSSHSKGKGKKSNAGNTTSAQYLGPGIRVGFQGLLHMEIFRQRLLNEFELDVIVTQPKIPYIIETKSKNHDDENETEIRIIDELSQWPSSSTSQTQKQHKITIKEPVVSIRIMSPSNYAGNILELIKKRRGFNMITTPTIDDQSWIVDADMPWAEVVSTFHDELKSSTAGYGSFDILDDRTSNDGTSDTTTDTENTNNPSTQINNFKYIESKLCKVDIVLNNDAIEPLAFVAHITAAQSKAKTICQQLQQVLPRQQFVTIIQAKVNSKIIASERIKPYRKDVLTKGGKTMGGGDVTRKKKLLEKQKKGKKKRQLFGKVTLSQEAFNSVIQK